jgi:carotenoid 1,2-hydratase
LPSFSLFAILYPKLSITYRAKRKPIVVQANPSTSRFVFTSSIASEAWRPQKDPKAYEWWYFDALSDDGREAVVIVFLDNFVYSPRGRAENNGSIVPSEPQGSPAVSFAYFVDGKVAYQTEHEFSAEEFSAGPGPKCRIGNCGFRFESASYGSGFLVSIDLPLAKGRHLRANLEWLSVESDLVPSTIDAADTEHYWNMAVPRSDVSGKITIQDDRKRTSDVRSFRGTGYHDHNLDNHWLARAVREWHWGRAHFADSTVVFYSYAELGDENPASRLLLVRGGELCSLNAEIADLEHGRDKFGIRYPARSRIVAEDGTLLETRVTKLIDPSFHHLRFVGSMKVTAHGREQSAAGITEFIAPQALKSGWLNWLRKFRNEKASFFR